MTLYMAQLLNESHMDLYSQLVYGFLRPQQADATLSAIPFQIFSAQRLWQ